MTKSKFNINGVSIPANLLEAYNCFIFMEDKEKVEFLKIAIESIQTKEVIKEMPKTAHDDRIGRKTRVTMKQRRHNKGKRPVARSSDPLAKTDLKRGRKSDNDGSKPGHGNLLANSDDAGQVLHVEGHFGEALKFIQENYNKEIDVQTLSGVKDKLALQNVVNRMMAFHKNGWNESGGKLTNGSVQADPNVWAVKEGILVNVKTGARAAHFDWLYQLRDQISEAIRSEMNIIEGMING